MLPGVYPETPVTSKGAEPLNSMQARPPKNARYVQETLGKLKHDFNRTEHNTRYHASQSPMQENTPEPKSGGEGPSRNCNLTPSDAPETPEPISAEQLQHGLPGLSPTRPDSRSSAKPFNGRAENFVKPGYHNLPASNRSTPDAAASTVAPGDSPTRARCGDDVVPEWPSGCWPAWSQDVPGRPWILADMARWRSAFQEEVQESVRTLRSAFKEADIPHLVAEFTEWRQREGQEKAEMRRHVEELLKVNASLRQAQLDWFTTQATGHIAEHLTSFGASLADISTRSERLLNLEGHIGKAVDDIGSMIQNLVKNIKQTNMDDVERRSVLHNQKTQGFVVHHLEEIQQDIARLVSEKHAIVDPTPSAGVDGQANVPLSALTQDGKFTPAFTSQLAQEIMEINQRMQGELAVSKRQRKKLAVDMTSRFLNTSESLQSLQSGSLNFDTQVNEAKELFTQVQENLMKECDNWQEKYVDANVKVHEAQREADQATMETHMLKQKVECMEIRLTQATARSGVEVIQKIKKVESNGNLKVNMDNGDVDVLRPLEFVPRSNKHEETSAEFVDPSLANHVIEDIADLQRLFHVNVVVEGHTKGTDSVFFQKVAENRANLIKAHLVADGVDSHFITAKGLPGPTGLNRPCVLIRLDIFPEKD